MAVPVTAGETFALELDFDDAVVGSRFESLTLVFPADDDPIPPGAGGSTSVSCTETSVPIPN